MATKGPRVAIYDQWHRVHPQPGAVPCRCSRGKNKYYPSATHEKGDRWQVRWTDLQGEPGRRNFPERNGDDLEIHAEAFAADLKSGFDAGKTRRADRTKITLQEFGEKWRANRPKSKWKTAKNRDDRLAYIIDLRANTPENLMRRKSRGAVPPIAGHSLAHLAEHPSEIQSWISWMEACGLAPNTIGNICRTLTAIFRAAIDDGIVTRNPVAADSVTLPSATRPGIVPWTAEQVEAAGRSIGAAHPRSRSIPKFGSGTGMRQGEIFGVGVDDFSFPEEIVYVRRQIKEVEHPETGESVLVFALPKNDKTREVPLFDGLAAVMKQQFKDHPPVEITLPWETVDGPATTVALVYVNFDGNAWTADSFNSRLWQPARRAAGVPDTRENGTHAMRHTFASALLFDGVDIKTLSEMLGHSNAAITLKYYAHLMPKAAHRVRQALDAFFSRPNEFARKMPGQDQTEGS